ncbi:7344_t:CDS:2, partial [Entrophospora sp. SA101]
KCSYDNNDDNLTKLPDEIIFLIIEYLDLCDIINLSILSKTWAILINNDIVWKILFLSEFLETKVFKTYKEQYQHHYITKGYDAVVSLPLFIFQKSCHDIRAIGGNVKIEINNNELKFIAESELVNGSIKLNSVCVMHKHIKFNVTNPISVQFSHGYFNYLIKFIRDLTSFENIKLYLSKNNSSLIEFKDDSSCKYYLRQYLEL